MIRFAAIGLILFFSFSLPLFSQVVSVRIFYNRDMPLCIFSPNNANYMVTGEGGKLFTATIHRNLQMKVQGDSIVMSEAGKIISVSSYFEIFPVHPDSSGTASFELRPDGGTKARHYPGSLTITAAAGSLILTNELPLEFYIPGVIQAEVGSVNPYEFKKLKAIIIRTYALSNLEKHKAEGFHLCDKVHCQVYNGKSYQKDISRAVFETAGQVLVDDSVRLISTLFFSNCGGHTSNAEDVWNKQVPYLVSVPDTFCLKKPGAGWTRKIPEKEWLDYFEKKFYCAVNDSAMWYALTHFDQPVRKKYFMEDGNCIPLRTIREDWKLRSTYFSVRLQGGQVFLNGRGFGHGVGLCQEGAMEMSKQGYSVREIIDHYYKGVLLVDLERIDFFRSSDTQDQ
ncbi:MAG: SpoIID/LytB domain-containing protein [Bacteroidia bacterium]|nr:SpoIID/LytB domain-containing protein [Bacteroidia bacterium]